MADYWSNICRKEECLSLMQMLGELLIQNCKIWPQKTRNTALLYGADSLNHLLLSQECIRQTNRWTDNGQTRSWHMPCFTTLRGQKHKTDDNSTLLICLTMTISFEYPTNTATDTTPNQTILPFLFLLV